MITVEEEEGDEEEGEEEAGLEEEGDERRGGDIGPGGESRGGELDVGAVVAPTEDKASPRGGEREVLSRTESFVWV